MRKISSIYHLRFIRHLKGTVVNRACNSVTGGREEGIYLPEIKCLGSDGGGGGIST